MLLRTILIFAMLATGCATIADKGADISDELRKDAEFVLCRAITVGAWYRAYASSSELMQAWSTLCAPLLKTTTQTVP